jgi:hypothetical protein
LSWQPNTNPPCWTCHWFGAMLPHELVHCLEPTCCAVRSQPEHGCSLHMKEAGRSKEMPECPSSDERQAWATQRRSHLIAVHEEANRGYQTWERAPVVKNREGDVRYMVPRSCFEEGPRRWVSEKPAPTRYPVTPAEEYLDRTWGTTAAESQEDRADDA